MILRGGTFLEPDGTEGTYRLGYYATPDGELILGCTFSIPTVHKGVAVNPDQVLSWGACQTYPKGEVTLIDTREIYVEVARLLHRTEDATIAQRAYMNEWTAAVVEDYPPVTETELEAALGTVPHVWMQDLISRFTSEAAMLETLWATIPEGLSLSPLPLSARAPYTKEAVAVERGLWTSLSMYQGWSQAIQNACTNQGVAPEVASKVALNFLRDSFGIGGADPIDL